MAYLFAGIAIFEKMHRMSQAVGAGRDRLGSNLPSLCIESALAHGGPELLLEHRVLTTLVRTRLSSNRLGQNSF